MTGFADRLRDWLGSLRSYHSPRSIYRWFNYTPLLEKVNMRSLYILGLIVLLGGCQYLGMAGAAADQAVKTKMQINDAKAEVLVKSICDISVGSFFRVLNRLERAAVTDLCGGERSGG
jgi:hypothetical protein